MINTAGGAADEESHQNSPDVVVAKNKGFWGVQRGGSNLAAALGEQPAVVRAACMPDAVHRQHCQ